MILITGGSGKIGSELVQLLKARGADFKVMARKEEVRADLKSRGIASVAGDFAQAKTFTPALAGVRTIFLLTVPSPTTEVQEGHFLEAARKAGVQHIVRLSAQGADPWAASNLLRVHGRCEAQLETCGLGWTILRPTMFMQNLAPMYGEAIAKTSTLYAPAGDARIPFVDTRDVAAVASVVLTSEGHEGLVYEITGSVCETYAGVAEILGAKLGRAIKYVDVPEDAAFQSMINMGMNGWFAHGIITLFHAFKANGDTAVPRGTVTRLTGRQPRTLQDYVQENLKAFQPVKAGAMSQG